MTLGKIAGTLKKYHWERICFFLAISVLLELTLFNRHVWLSLGSTPSVLGPVASGLVMMNRAPASISRMARVMDSKE